VNIQTTYIRLMLSVCGTSNFCEHEVYKKSLFPHFISSNSLVTSISEFRLLTLLWLADAFIIIIIIKFLKVLLRSMQCKSKSSPIPLKLFAIFSFVVNTWNRKLSPLLPNMSIPVLLHSSTLYRSHKQYRLSNWFIIRSNPSGRQCLSICVHYCM